MSYNMITTSNSFHVAAKEYLSLGFNPIPLLKNSKKPAVSWDPYQIEKILPSTLDSWYRAGLWNGVAIICGFISHIVVIDCDSKEIYDKIHGLAPPTWISKSGSGKSWHFYVGVNYRVKTRRIDTPWGHVDVQGEGAYVVAPPSLHEKTCLPYEWEKESSELAKFEEFDEVFDFLKLNTDSSKKPIREVVKGPIKKGSRNNSAIRYAGYLNHAIKLDPETILFELNRWNQAACDPPLSEREIETIWNSAMRYKLKESNVREVTGFEG